MTAPESLATQPILREVELLRQGAARLRAWHEKYGEHSPQWLPPGGDVRWLEDVDAALADSARAIRAALSSPAPAAGADQQPVTVRWERRRGYGYGEGINALSWQAWEPCTEAEAKRVTGLRSWEVRRLDCFASPAAVPAVLQTADGVKEVPHG